MSTGALGGGMAGLLADLSAGFAALEDQAALLITDTGDSGRMCVVILIGSGPEHDAAVAAYQSQAADNNDSTDPDLRAAS